MCRLQPWHCLQAGSFTGSNVKVGREKFNCDEMKMHALHYGPYFSTIKFNYSKESISGHCRGAGAVLASHFLRSFLGSWWTPR